MLAIETVAGAYANTISRLSIPSLPQVRVHVNLQVLGAEVGLGSQEELNVLAGGVENAGQVGGRHDCGRGTERYCRREVRQCKGARGERLNFARLRLLGALQEMFWLVRTRKSILLSAAKKCGPRLLRLEGKKSSGRGTYLSVAVVAEDENALAVNDKRESSRAAAVLGRLERPRPRNFDGGHETSTAVT